MNQPKRVSIWDEIPQETWSDWSWQFRNRLRSREDLMKIMPLTKEEDDVFRRHEGFAVGITPYFASLIDPSDPQCPIRRQVIPTVHELAPRAHGRTDPLAEERKSPVANVFHRYPDRVVLIVTETCNTYCRHCTRRRRVGFRENSITEQGLTEAVQYMAAHKEIRDVLISGGDPLCLSDHKLGAILHRIRQINHVEVIRIGSRAPVTNPFRITDELVAMLREYHPVWMNIQFNHYREITAEAAGACDRILCAGVPLGNQSVLLRGLNDTVADQKRLVQKLVSIRVRPYYLYQCDLAEGLEHFRTPVTRGMEIIEGLRGHTSGFAVPTFVIDAPGGGGKVPVSPQYLVSQSPEKVTLRNFEGNIYYYPEPEN